MQVKVVDSIMGSGKTTWAIKYMNAHPDMKFVYVTPFLAECDRIQEACPALRFWLPVAQPTKQASFKRLLIEGKNIATTHSLLAGLSFREEEMAALAKENYTFILDEALEVINPIEMLNQYDIDLLNSGYLQPENEGSQYMRWISEEVPGRYNDIKAAADAGTLVTGRSKSLFWILPISLLQAIPNLIVMTFLFEASHLAQYFKVYHIPYEKYHIAHGELQEGPEDLSAMKERLLSLIDLYEGKYNHIGKDYYDLSANKWRTNEAIRVAALNAAYNYFRTYCHAPSPDCIYSGFKINGEDPIVLRYRKAFLPCNSRAINTYGDRHCLAYLVNIFENPVVTSWFTSLGADFDKELAALSTTLQWIWRSAIRNGEPIKLFLPSSRMRSILLSWLNS